MRITRRGVLVGAGIAGGGLALGAIGVGTYVATYDQRSMQRSILPGKNFLTQWISIAPDGRVTLHGPHTEMGQGLHSSLLQILLDEMDCDPAITTYELAPADPAFTLSDMAAGLMEELAGVDYNGWTGGFLRDALGRAAQHAGLQFTGGSLSVRFTGWGGIRRVGASARTMLAQAGAESMGVPVSEVRTENGRVIHDRSNRSLGYGELAEAAAKLAIPEAPQFKTSSEYKFIGKDFPRIDLPEKVYADPVYGIDTDIPGMRYAAVAPPPLAQGVVTGVQNKDEIENRKGVERVVVLEDAVAVVADNPWRAEQAARALQITCNPPEGGPIDHQAHEKSRMEAVKAGGELVLARGESLESLDGDDVVTATYVTPYYAHAPLEPMNATVWEEEGKHHIATGTQGPLNTRYAAAEALERDFEDVVLHAKTMGGSFGRRNALVSASLNWIRQACKTQKAVGGAVKMIWSREADMQMSTYHPADAAHMRARLGTDGKPIEWLSDAYHGLMAMEEIMPPYDIPRVTARSVSGSPALPYGYWRSVVQYPTTHFIECFVDELAKKAGIDPIEYRLSMLEGRAASVVEKVAEMADWKGSKVDNRGYGVAFVNGFGSYAAAIVEATLEDNSPVVHQVWCAVDCGIPVSPNGVQAQAQGGIYWGLSAALNGKIEFNQGSMLQTNFHNYRIANFQTGPRVHVEVMRTQNAPIGGAGELSTPLAGPALSNALAALSDRIRSLPLT